MKHFFRSAVMTVCFVSLVSISYGVDDRGRKESIREMHDRCEDGLKAIIEHRNFLSSELCRLQRSLREIFPGELEVDDGEGGTIENVDALVNNLDELKAELNNMPFVDEEKLNIIDQMQIIKDKMHADDALIAVIDSLVPRDIIDVTTGEDDDSLENKIEQWSKAYSKAVSERKTLGEQKDMLDEAIKKKKAELRKTRSELTRIRKKYKEVEGYFTNIVGIVAENS